MPTGYILEDLHKKDNAFAFQIAEMRQYTNHLDEKIAIYRKQGRDPSRLQDNKARALQTIEHLKQAETGHAKTINQD